MDKNFCMGLCLGLIGGIVAAANSYKIRKAVQDGQEQILTAVNKMQRKDNEKDTQQVKEDE